MVTPAGDCSSPACAINQSLAKRARFTPRTATAMTSLTRSYPVGSVSSPLKATYFRHSRDRIHYVAYLPSLLCNLRIPLSLSFYSRKFLCIKPTCFWLNTRNTCVVTFPLFVCGFELGPIEGTRYETRSPSSLVVSPRSALFPFSSSPHTRP
jgi:hypothetical protein